MNSFKAPGRFYFNIEYTLTCPYVPPLLMHKESFAEMLGLNAGMDVLYFAQYTCFSHPLHKDEYRIDLKLKENTSGWVLWFGIHITKEEFERLTKLLENERIYMKTVTWEHVKRYNYKHVNMFTFSEKDAEKIIKRWEAEKR